MTNKFDEVAPEIWEVFNEVAAEAQARSFQYMRIVVPSPGEPPDWRGFMPSRSKSCARICSGKPT